MIKKVCTSAALNLFHLWRGFIVRRLSISCANMPRLFKALGIYGRLYFYLYLLVIAGCCNVTQRVNYIAPVNIPNTIREMKTAGFWTSKLQDPDKLILDAEGIEKFNTKLESQLNVIINPINNGAQYNGKSLKNDLIREMANFSKRKLYDFNEKAANESFYKAIKKNMNLSEIPDKINVRFGFLSHYANQRLIPTDEILTEKAGDFGFDEVQNSSLDAGTPLIILHESRDGLWVYANAPSSSGWFKKDKLSFCAQNEFRDLLMKKDFVVVTQSKADIFLDPSLNKYYDYVRMGAKFALSGASFANVFEILIPTRQGNGKLFIQQAYIKKEDVNLGYLPYTSRNIIEQAFKLIDAPYGWGGMYGEQDCSSYIQEIFQTVGINLPRNSSAQGKTGVPLGDFKGGTKAEEKLKIIKQDATAGATILQMKGHIVLYIGMYKNTPYIIHETHGFGQKIKAENIIWIVNRVIVSDLALGEGSKKGSLLSRIINIRMVK